MCTTNDQNSTPKSTTYDPNKWIYIPSFNANADHSKAPRYVLGTRGQKPLICICENPSTAVPDDLDKTLKRISTYVEQSDRYDSWIVLNLYPYRAKNPEDLPKEMDNRLHQSNLKAIEFVLSQFDQPDLWLAWGGDIMKTNRQYLIECVRDFISLADAFQPQYRCAQTTADGHPRHPSRLSDPITLDRFNMNEYRTQISRILAHRARRDTHRTTN